MSGIHLISLVAVLALAGYGPAISTGLVQQAAQEPRAPGGFAALKANPEQFQGKLVILGGEVISVSPKDGGSLLALNQRELDASLAPYGTGYGGIFYVESATFLSPSFYVPKRKVTVAGVVKGRLDGAPLLTAREIHLGDYPPCEKWYAQSWSGNAWNKPPPGHG